MFSSRKIIFYVLTVAAIFTKAVQCKSNKTHGKRIVGGTRVSPGEIAYLVSISDENGSHFCGGSLIHVKNIVTAAHCFFDETHGIEDPNKIFLKAGQDDITRDDDSLQKLYIYAVAMHPNYDHYMKINDVAMIRLVKPAQLTSLVKIIRLPRERPETGTSCTVAGWGLTADTGTEAHPTLLKVTIKVLDFHYCENDELGPVQEASQICAGDIAGGKDSCRGDSGGSLECGGILSGIVSFGYGCGEADTGAIYSDVLYYKTWIQSMIDWDGNTSMPSMRKIDEETLEMRMNRCSKTFALNSMNTIIFYILLQLN